MPFSTPLISSFMLFNRGREELNSTESTCAICLDVIAKKAHHWTHSSCGNSFHRECHASWRESLRAGASAPRCAACQQLLDRHGDPSPEWIARKAAERYFDGLETLFEEQAVAQMAGEPASKLVESSLDDETTDRASVSSLADETTNESAASSVDEETTDEATVSSLADEAANKPTEPSEEWIDEPLIPHIIISPPESPTEQPPEPHGEFGSLKNHDQIPTPRRKFPIYRGFEPKQYYRKCWFKRQWPSPLRVLSYRQKPFIDLKTAIDDLMYSSAALDTPDSEISPLVATLEKMEDSEIIEAFEASKKFGTPPLRHLKISDERTPTVDFKSTPLPLQPTPEAEQEATDSTVCMILTLIFSLFPIAPIVFFQPNLLWVILLVSCLLFVLVML